MKRIQQYCDVVNRMKQDPACKQAVLEKARRPRSIFARRGMFTGTAAAAALLALNIGLGGYILQKAAEKSETADSDTIEITEAVTGTNASGVNSGQTETTVLQTVVTAAAEQGKTVPEQTAQNQTAQNQTATDRTEQAAKTEQTVTEQTAQTTVQPKQGPVQPVETVKPKDDQLSFLLIPADRPYTFAGYDAEAPVVCHVRPSEKFSLQLRVWNDPGMTDFNIDYNIQTFDMVLGNNMVGYGNSVAVGGSSNIGAEKDRFMNFYSYEWKWAEDPLPDDTVLYEITLLAPTEPGHYMIRETEANEHLNNVGCLSPDTGRRFLGRCEISGIEIIVDEEDYTSVDEAEWLFDPEAETDRVLVYAEPIVAHAGQKNVPVNVWIKGCQPFETGSIIKNYDLTLEPLVTDETASSQMERGENDLSGIGLEGTLLEQAMWCSASKIPEAEPVGRINVTFNTYWRYSKNGPVYSDHADTEIRDEGVLLRLYFDMPEKCGRYRLYVACVNISGFSSAYGPQSSVDLVPTDIIVVP